MLAQDALDQFQARYERRTVQHGARWIWVKIGFVTLPIPNPGHLRAHDLHHAMLEAAPTLEGEAHVGVFELRSGCPTLLIGFLCAGAVLLGLFQRPRAVMRWWRAYRGCRNFYRHPELDRILTLELEQVRSMALRTGS